MNAKFLLFGLLLLAGCSKKDPEPEFFVSATIDGKPWTANVANSQNTNVAAIINQNLVVVVGAQDVDKAVTSVGVVFPKSIVLNQAVAINPAKNVALAYSTSQTEGYSADPAKGGSGTLTVTRFDETAKIVEGTFSGEAIHNQNSSRIRITNGRFRTAIYTVNVTTPTPGKK
jgi:hypothetical protein